MRWTIRHMHVEVCDAEGEGRHCASGIGFARVPVDVVLPGPLNFRHIQARGPTGGWMLCIDRFSYAAPDTGSHRNGIDETDPPQPLVGVTQLNRQAQPSTWIVGQRDLYGHGTSCTAVLSELSFVGSCMRASKDDEQQRGTERSSDTSQRGFLMWRKVFHTRYSNRFQLIS